MRARIKAEELAFVCRKVDCPGRPEGIRFIAELVDASGMGTVPMCVAWLTDARPATGVILDFLIVPFDDNRRRGYATRMVDELDRCFPGILGMTDPVTEEGDRFVEHLEQTGRLTIVDV